MLPSGCMSVYYLINARLFLEPQLPRHRKRTVFHLQKLFLRPLPFPKLFLRPPPFPNSEHVVSQPLVSTVETPGMASVARGDFFSDADIEC